MEGLRTTSVETRRSDTGAGPVYVEPRGTLEKDIALLWKEVFKIDRVGRNDNFFELGGDSLTGMDLMEKVAERFDLQLPVVMLFQNPTPRQMGQYIGTLEYEGRQRMLEQQTAEEDIEFLLALPNSQAPRLLQHLRDSRAQFRQDLFLLSELDFKRQGYFVEFGATDGYHLSNTHLLEKKFGWNGILAEPARCWHTRLRENRSAPIETRCVWSTSGSQICFNEVQTPELSTINSFSDRDAHAETRIGGTTYEVETVSLTDLLKEHGAPQQLDYLSIDTEGSELAILAAFDFARYSFAVITCEHNFTPQREEIHSLLSRQGYVRKFEELSKVDDWYVRQK